MSINNFIKEPTPPGDWVDEISCSCCGEKYSEFNSKVTFKDGCDLIRSMNQPNGGYRSKRIILYAMRIIKLTHWYIRHMFCGVK